MPNKDFRKIIEGKKVLVTGGAGFIGSNLCESLLMQGNKVVCFDDFSTGKIENIESLLTHPDFLLVRGSICNFEECKKVVKGMDLILHQAALGSVPRSIHDPLTTNNINIGGFVNMIFAAVEGGVKRFVYAASSSTYGDHPGLTKVENKIGKPLSPYAVSKYANELYSGVFSSLYGIETIGLRYFNVFGKKQDPEGAYAAAIPKFIKSFIEGKSPVIYGDGNQSRDFTYVENVVHANNLAATTQNPKALNNVFNVAYGESTNLNELVILLRDFLLPFDHSISNIKIIYEKERIGDIVHSLASIKKAKRLLRYSPQFDLKKGLEKAIHWYWENLQRGLPENSAGKKISI